MPTRDEFPKPVLDTLAKRVGFRCSNPDCRQLTAGPREDETKTVNIGVAAHITSAARGGPRFDGSISAADRGAFANGIWLCQNCAKLIDNDPSRYSIEVLQTWKVQAEDAARAELEGSSTSVAGSRPSAELIIQWRKVKITSEMHEYRLELSVHNVGGKVLRDYHVDVELPTAVLIDRSGVIDGRSDREKSLFRAVWRSDADDVFPGDRKIVLTIPYLMNTELFWRKEDFFGQMVRATLHFDGKQQVMVERPFRELQCF
jgi:hypothetical protein